MIPFGPQLIGQAEKALNAILAHVLAEVALSEPQWVALRLTAQMGEEGDLATFIRDAAHFHDARGLISALEARGFVADDRLTDDGRAFLSETQGRIRALTASIWEGLPAEDVAVAERVLNAVRERASAIAASLADGTR